MTVRGLNQDVPLTPATYLRRAEALHGDREVVEWRADGSRRATTYAAWVGRARRVAGALDALGVPPGGVVATMGWQSLAHSELFVGVPAAGRVFHGLNPRLHARHLAVTVRSAGDAVAFVERSLLAPLAAVVEGCPSVRTVVVVDDGTPLDEDAVARIGVPVLDHEELLATAPPGDLEVADERAAAYLSSTTGTSGDPKGVLHSHRAAHLQVLSALAADNLGVGEADTVLALGPFFHANGLDLPFVAAAAGARLVLPGPARAPEALASLLEAERVTVTIGVPAVVDRLPAALAGRDLSALRLLAVGSSHLAAGTAAALDAAVGHPVVRHCFGMSEVLPPALVTAPRGGPGGDAGGLAAVGRPVVGLEARVVPLVDGGPSADGRGELHLRGPWVAGAYLGGEEGSALTPDGWLPTGDLAAIDAGGRVRLLGRLKDLVKSGGLWIAPAELEALLLAHPDVDEVAVVGVPDERWGERPIAVVVPVEGRAPGLEALRLHLADDVERWALPDRVVLVDALPRNAGGKVDKARLRAEHGGAPG